MKAGKQIWYLIKFFSKQEYAEMFMDGKLHMNRLSYFKPLETSRADGRGDPSEAVSHWWQPHDTIIKLNFPGFPELTITKEDLGAPTSMAYEFHDHLHIFCMYAMSTEGFECIDGKIDYPLDQADELKRQLLIDERCFNFGEHAVIVPAVPFIERVKAALAATSLQARIKAVEYFDGSTFHGAAETVDIPFRKLKEFTYQNELRICLDTQTRGDDVFVLQLGNLRDFSSLVRSSELNTLFRIDSISV